jgi:hypothetical protein
MLGGVNNGLFFQGFGGFFAMLVFIPILIWMAASKEKKATRALRRSIRRSLRALKRK